MMARAIGSMVFLTAMGGVWPLVSMWALHGDFRPWQWGVGPAGFSAWVFVAQALIGLSFLGLRYLDASLEGLFWGLFDIFELQEMPLVDFILRHYFSLGACLLLLAGAAWAGDLYFSSALAAAGFPLGLALLEGMLFLRTMMGTVRRSIAVLPLLLLMAMVDTAILGRAIHFVAGQGESHARFLPQGPREQDEAEIFQI